MEKKWYIPFLLVLTWVFSGNVLLGKPVMVSGHKTGVMAGMDTLVSLELPLPVIPDSLRTPQSRAAYLLVHFWDEMDFGDTLRSRHRPFIERNFVNFASLFPHAEKKTLVPAVRKLMQAAEADSIAYTLLAEVTEMYLYMADSPMRCEEYYIPFLEEFVRTPAFGEYDKARHAYLLEMAKKNRVGTLAADFTYFSRGDGRPATLHQLPGEWLLLLFYDADCESCWRTMADIHGNARFRRWLHDKRLTVLAVYAEGDREVWERTKERVPEGWNAGFEAGDMYRKELYVMPSMPTVYLLDKEKKVVLKETSVETLFRTLSTYLPSLTCPAFQ